MKHFSAHSHKRGFFNRHPLTGDASWRNDRSLRKLGLQSSTKTVHASEGIDEFWSDAKSYAKKSVRRHSDVIVSPVFVLFALGQFLWSVMIRILKRFQPITFLFLILVLGFAAGFVFFSEKVTRQQQPVLVDPADAIVVLTGGQSRIHTGVDLLRAKLGKRLLITGVNPTTNKTAIQSATNSDSRLFECCIDLDRSALNTIGNAAESERWIRANGYHRVVLVTNDYHMPRSILEMSNRMPDVEFIAYPVINDMKRDQSWISQGDMLRVLFTEYVKYIGAFMRMKAADTLGKDIIADIF